MKLSAKAESVETLEKIRAGVDCKIIEIPLNEIMFEFKGVQVTRDILESRIRFRNGAATLILELKKEI